MSWHIEYIRFEHIVGRVEFGQEKLINIFFEFTNDSHFVTFFEYVIKKLNNNNNNILHVIANRIEYICSKDLLE